MDLTEKQRLIWDNQMLKRCEKLEKENRELKSTLLELNWLIELIKKFKKIGELISEQRENVECRQRYIYENGTKKQSD